MDSGVEHGRIGIHLPGIIKTLGEHLYSEKSVAIRELIQNANDSLVRRQAEDPARPVDLRIEFRCNYREDFLAVQDNGAGMTEREVQNDLSTVGRSGTDQFRKALEQRDPEQARKLIGRFGLGFLSAFVIAHSVEVRTRSYQRGESGLIWRCDGGADYTLSKTSEVPIGTQVILHLQTEHDEFADPDKLVPIIRRYADFISFPIHVGDTPLPVNVQTPPWHSGAATAEYVDYVQKRFGEDPLDVLPLVPGREAVGVGGVLYVPRTRQADAGQVELYVSRMYVGADREMLPGWARFIRGVIDTPVLDVTTSREVAVRNDKYRQVQALIAGRVNRFITDMASNDRPRFNQLVKTHEHAVKVGALEDDNFFGLVKDHIQFDSDSGKVTIPQYLERASRRSSDRVRTIYFHTGGVECRQHQLLFAANGIPVLDAEEHIDRAFIERYADRTKGVRAKSIDQAADSLFDAAPAGQFADLVARYADMSIEAKAVAFKPTSVPALLIQRGESGPDDLLRHLREDSDLSEELRGVFEALFAGRLSMNGPGWLLYLNTANEVILLLKDLKGNEEVARQCMKEIYNSAYLVAVKGLSIHEVEKMAEIHTQTVCMLLKLSQSNATRELPQTREKPSWLRRWRH